MCNCIANNVCRCLLFILSIIVSIVAVILIVFSIIYINPDEVIYDSYLTASSAVAILMALLVLVDTVVVGTYCGNCKQQPKYLRLYAYTIFGIAPICFVVGVVASVASNYYVKRSVEDLFENFSRNETRDVDYIQKTYECCGPEGKFNWATPILESCCSSKSCKETERYTEGCINAVVFQFRDYKERVSVGVLCLLFCITPAGIIALYMGAVDNRDIRE